MVTEPLPALAALRSFLERFAERVDYSWINQHLDPGG
jgi:hypothetical protein